MATSKRPNRFIMFHAKLPLCVFIAVVFIAATAQEDDSKSAPTDADAVEIDLRLKAQLISTALKEICDDELGLSKMQAIFDSIHHHPPTDNEIESSNKANVMPPKDPPSFVYHRLDLLTNPPKICKYFKQLATLDTSSLFLSLQSFKAPSRFANEEESTLSVQRFVTYINDHTRLLSNPGLKYNIRQEVLEAARITKTWKNKAQSGQKLENYVVRRYVGTVNGLFLSYPGTLIERSYDPTRRMWFRNALASPGKIIFTAPYLDIGGAGYLVTLSHAVYERNCSRRAEFKSDCVIGVMGIDFTLGYFHKLLMDSIDVCGQEHVTCFIMDDRGYLVAHPGLVEPAGRGPVEYTHIIHKEPFVANDLLNHKNFVKKNVCNSYADQTIQRFYNFNATLEGVLTNLVHGAQCAKYQIAAVPHTNVFIGVVNQTCETMTAFCPCSMTDRLCLNCHRMEQTDCECPCECPLDVGVTSIGHMLDEEEYDNPNCSPYSEELVLPTIKRSDSVPSCFQVDCSLRKSESDCQGVLGCEWCQLDSTGSPLKEKFCNYQRECFGGVLGVRTPYADEMTEQFPPDVPFSKVTPFSFVIVVFIICFVLLFTIYCYRYHVQRVTGPLYVTAPRETTVRMFQLDNEPDDQLEPYELSPPVQKNVLLATFENPALSPYRLNPGYRRPPGGESDHGYSTMTPHENDSEHMGPLLAKDRHRIPTSTQSVASSSRASSPVHHLPRARNSMPLTMQTILTPTALTNVPQEGSHVLAQVQVHMVDSH